jgi:hypothetical protein
MLGGTTAASREETKSSAQACSATITSRRASMRRDVIVAGHFPLLCQPVDAEGRRRDLAWVRPRAILVGCQRTTQRPTRHAYTGVKVSRR